MSDEEFKTLTNRIIEINSIIQNGLATKVILDEINNSIYYLNIELEYEERETPSDNLSFHYQKVELCWLYYKVRDQYFSYN